MGFVPTNNIPPVPHKAWIWLYIIFLLLFNIAFIWAFWPIGMIVPLVSWPIIALAYSKRHVYHTFYD